MKIQFIELKVGKTEVTDVSFGILRFKTFVPKKFAQLESSDVSGIGIDVRVLRILK